jgi:trk system potassium uptake protein TrkA
LPQEPRRASSGGAAAEVVMAHHDTVIEPEDHLIVFVANERMIARVEKLFQVGVGIF